MAKKDFKLGVASGKFSTPRVSNASHVASQLSQLNGSTVFKVSNSVVPPGSKSTESAPIAPKAEGDKMPNHTAYPWDQCIEENTKKYGKESAEKICGSIKAKYGNCNECTREKIDNAILAAFAAHEKGVAPNAAKLENSDTTGDMAQTPTPGADMANSVVPESKANAEGVAPNAAPNVGDEDDDDDDAVAPNGAKGQGGTCGCGDDDDDDDDDVENRASYADVVRIARTPQPKVTDVYQEAAPFMLNNQALPPELQARLDAQIAIDFPDVASEGEVDMNKISNAWSDAARAAALEARRAHRKPEYKFGKPDQRPPIGTTSSGKTIEHHNADVYRLAEPRRGWTTKVNPLMDHREGGQMLRQRLPDWSKKDHEEAAAAHLAAANAARDKWSKTADEAAMKTFGRKYDPIQDYKVSGIGRDEFGEEHKNALRESAADDSYHRAASDAHWRAARHTNFRSQPGRVGNSSTYRDVIAQARGAADRVSNAGTSEGAKKGWLNRHGVKFVRSNVPSASSLSDEQISKAFGHYHASVGAGAADFLSVADMGREFRGKGYARGMEANDLARHFKENYHFLKKHTPGKGK